MLTLSQKWLLFFAFIMGFISVAASAFGAHALKNKLEPNLLNAFEVAARYQMYHVLAIPIAVWLSKNLVGWLFVAGIIVFSGSLYALSLSGIKVFGAIVPVGGILFLLGWLFLAIAIFF